MRVKKLNYTVGNVKRVIEIYWIIESGRKYKIEKLLNKHIWEA
jgi:hypothetical protein